MGLDEYSTMMSLILLSMYGCPPALVYAARMRILLVHPSTSPRVRDITDVMASVTETAELHDAFIQAYEAPSWNGKRKSDLLPK